MPPTGALETATANTVHLAKATRGQIKPIGWAALIFFLVLTFVFYFWMISEL